MSSGRQSGLGMAELMIAMAIGAIVTLLAFTLLLSARAGHLSLTEAAQVDDAGRFAVGVIERAARQSGALAWEPSDAAGVGAGAYDPAAAVAGLDDASLSADSEALTSAQPDAVNGSDILALRFAGSRDGAATTCAGFAVGEGKEGWSIFYVGRSGRGVPELRCKYHGAREWTADAVVANVDSFQVLYGLDTDATPDGVPNRYVRATDIHQLDGALTLEGATDIARARDRSRRTHWKRVVSIKVALMLHGERNAASAGPSLYALFGSAYGGSDRGTRITREDLAPAVRQRERRVFTSTIVLRNRVGAT